MLYFVTSKDAQSPTLTVTRQIWEQFHGKPLDNRYDEDVQVSDDEEEDEVMRSLERSPQGLLPALTT